MFTALIVVVGVVAAVLLLAKKAYKVNKHGIILITGASTGIGRHAAEYLANNHSFLILAGVRKETDAAQIRNLGIKNLQPVIVDVADHVSCVACIESIKQTMAKLQLPFVGLVNNAGVNRHLPAEFQPLEDAKALFNTNFFGVLDMTQLVLPLLRESKGRIVNISSVSGLISVPTMGLYSASKFAVEGLSDALRRELDHFGVSVSIVEPAFVKTTIAATTEAISGELVKDPVVNAQMRSLYAVFFAKHGPEKMANLMKHAADPIVTSQAMEHALTAKYPKTRYPVANSEGTPSWVLQWVIWLLSDRLNDILIKNK